MLDIDKWGTTLQGWLTQAMDPSADDQYFLARESQLRADTQKMAGRGSVRRGINPNDPHAKAMESELLAPHLANLTVQRKAASADRLGQGMQLFQFLMQLDELESAKKSRAAAAAANAGGYMPPPGVGIGSITNPDSLNTWNHMPSGPWQGSSGFAFSGDGPNTRMNGYLNAGGR